MRLYRLLNNFSKFNRRIRLAYRFNNLFTEFIHMRIVEDKDGERFLVIESDEDFEKFKEDLLNIAREKAKDRARKPSYETQSPK